jgi:hypothetical protein
MNSKERVRRALRKEPVDRPPVFMWFHPRTRDLLAGMLEIPPETPIDNIFAMYEEVGISRPAVFDAAADIRRRAIESSIIPG